MTRFVSTRIIQNLPMPGNKQTNPQLSWLLVMSWAFRNPARMRLEAQLGPWIVDLEQPNTDTLKGQDNLLSQMIASPIQTTSPQLPSDLVSNIFFPSVLLSQLTLCNAAVDELYKREIQDEVRIVNVVKTLPSIFLSKNPNINEDCSPEAREEQSSNSLYRTILVHSRIIITYKNICKKYRVKRLPDWSQWQISHLLQRDKISSTKFQNERFLPAYSWIYVLGRCSMFAQQLKKSYSFHAQCCLVSPLENRLWIISWENNTKLSGLVPSNLGLA